MYILHLYLVELILFHVLYLGNIYEPVIAGQIQNKGLGMDVDIFNDNGKSIKK